MKWIFSFGSKAINVIESNKMTGISSLLNIRRFVSSLTGFNNICCQFLPVYCPYGTNDTKPGPAKDTTLVAKCITETKIP
jgi:hypothetical protein